MLQFSWKMPRQWEMTWSPSQAHCRLRPFPPTWLCCGPALCCRNACARNMLGRDVLHGFPCPEKTKHCVFSLLQPSLWRRRLVQASVPQPRIWEPHGQSQMNGNQRIGAQSPSAGAGLKTNERTEEGKKSSSNYCELLKTQNKSLLFRRVPFAACNFISPPFAFTTSSGHCQNNLIYKWQLWLFFRRVSLNIRVWKLSRCQQLS